MNRDVWVLFFAQQLNESRNVWVPNIFDTSIFEEGNNRFVQTVLKRLETCFRKLPTTDSCSFYSECGFYKVWKQKFFVQTLGRQFSQWRTVNLSNCVMKELFGCVLCDWAIRGSKTLCVGLVLEEALDLPKWARIRQIDAKFSWVVLNGGDWLRNTARVMALVLEQVFVGCFKLSEITHVFRLLVEQLADKLFWEMRQGASGAWSSITSPTNVLWNDNLPFSKTGWKLSFSVTECLNL